MSTPRITWCQVGLACVDAALQLLPGPAVLAVTVRCGLGPATLGLLLAELVAGLGDLLPCLRDLLLQLHLRAVGLRDRGAELGQRLLRGVALLTRPRPRSR